MWKLQYGRPGESSIIEKSPAQLLTFVDYPWFALTPDAAWCQMRVQVDAATTSGSTYPRTELRELTNGWDTSKGTHRLDYTIRIPVLPPGKPELVGGQIHDASKDLMEILFRRASSGGVEVTWRIDGSSSGQKVVPFSASGARCRLEAVNGVLNFYIGDFTKPVFSTTNWPKSTSAYFKVGAYVQSNETKDKPPAYGQADLRDVVVTHSSSSTPAPPPPSPPPANASTIMIIRHGEKPADANDHTLNATGRQRALNLVPLFTDGKRLPVPGRIYASKGTTASMRPLQTIQPTADKLKLTPITKYDAENAISAMSKELKALPGVTLVSLEHSAIPGIAKGLGSSDVAIPGSWPDDRFDEVWVFTGDGKGGWKFTQVPELVMPGDKTTPIK